MKQSFVFVLLCTIFLTACRPAAPTSVGPTTQLPAPTVAIHPTATIAATTLPPTNTATPQATSTPLATPTPVAIDPTATPLAPFQTGAVWVYPGSLHFEGDILSIEIPVGNLFAFEDTNATVTIDGGEPVTMKAGQTVNVMHHLSSLLLIKVFDTTGQVGNHNMHVQATMRDAVPIDVIFAFEVRPASERPQQEISAEWLVKQTECCEIQYISGTAAARDIEPIAQKVQDSYQRVEELFGKSKDQTIFKIILIDNMWGNGGFSGEEGLIISYPDRNYAPSRPENLEMVLRHEITHRLAGNLVSNEQVPGFLGEGIAVYTAGGHYKEEPIPERVAALEKLGYFVPVAELADQFGNLQHEASYLESAAVIDYMIEKYGRDGFARFLGTHLEGDDVSYPPSWLDGALQQTFKITLDQFEADFLAWVKSHDPGDQLQDLRLTMQLQNIRRDYQLKWALFASIYRYGSLTMPENLSLVMREPDAPENVAIEALIINGEQALLEGRSDAAEEIVLELRKAVYGGDLSGDLIANNLLIAQKLADQPYEIEDIDLEGDQAEVLVSGESAELQTIHMQKQGEEWVIQAAG